MVFVNYSSLFNQLVNDLVIIIMEERRAVIIWHMLCVHTTMCNTISANCMVQLQPRVLKIIGV